MVSMADSVLSRLSGFDCRGGACRGRVRRGAAGQGWAWHGKARYGKDLVLIWFSWLGKAGLGQIRLGVDRHDKARFQTHNR